MYGFVLVGCLPAERVFTGMNNHPVVNLEASVYTLGNTSRTVTDESGSTTFSEGDELGFLCLGKQSL